jgi:hypothetical protein
MRVTNLITDYIVIGFIAVMAIILPFVMFYGSETVLKEVSGMLPETDVWAQAWVIVPTVTGILYVFGMIYNQVTEAIVDRIEGRMWLTRLFGLTKKVRAKKRVEGVLRMGYHYALQRVVVGSTSAYNYLSFRRTIIRVVRNSITAIVIVVLLNIILPSVYARHQQPEFSLVNALIIVGLITVFFAVVRPRYVRLNEGFYHAIIYFNQIIDEPKPPNSNVKDE